MSANPTALQLRYLQTLLELGSSQASTIVFPLPIDLLKPLLEATTPSGDTPSPRPAAIPHPEAESLEAGHDPHELAELTNDHGDMEAVEAQVERVKAHHHDEPPPE